MIPFRRLALVISVVSLSVIAFGAGCGKVIGLESDYVVKGGAGAAGAACSAEIGDECDVSGDCCDFPDARCAEFQDAKGASIGKACTPTCHSDGECNTGCCVPAPNEAGTKICGLAFYCGDQPGSVCAIDDDCITSCCPQGQLHCALPEVCDVASGN